MSQSYKGLVQFVLLGLMFGFTGCQTSEEPSEFSHSFSIELENPLEQKRENVLIELKLADIQKLYPSFNPKGFVVFDGDNEIPAQFSPNTESIHFVLSQLESEERKEIQIQFSESQSIERSYPKLTQAELSIKKGGYFENRKYVGGDFENVLELRVPEEHTDHSFFIRYEGPGWESDKVGYRFYLDWRNGIDVFGKKVSSPVLQEVGLDGFDSYHDMQEWGMDVLKVGKSLGLGSLATFENGAARRIDVTDSVYTRILENGSVFSAVETTYWGWDIAAGKTDVKSTISIHAGTRLSKMDLQFSSTPPNFSTGLIAEEDKAELIQSNQTQKYSYMATWGTQSLAGDNLGIAIIYPTELYSEVQRDEFSHVVILTPTGKDLSYYFLAAWEQEQDGIKSKEEFIAYLEKTILELSNPVQVNF